MLDTSDQLESLMKDPWSTPLETLDPSQGALFLHQKHHEVFRRLRKEDPVHFTPDSPFNAFWSITKFDHIVEIDSDHRRFSNAPTIAIGEQDPNLKTQMFIASDPPKHTVQRQAVQSAVGPKRLAELEPLIRERVGDILDGLPRGETFNWVDLVSREMTMRLLATLFDIPQEDRHLLTKWSDASTNSPNLGAADVDIEARNQTLLEALDYFSALWRRRAAEPAADDFISLFAHNKGTEALIESPLELLGNIILLIVGGNDTTRNSASGGVVALNQFPAEYDKLRADTGLIPNMVSEIIRYQTPISHMRRLALEDVAFHGKTIRAGEKVVMWYCSGNRDEDAIPQADRFLIDRPKARHHVSFGFGIHRCMGNRVAEMQLTILWEEIMKRFHRIELVDEPVRVFSNFVNGFDDVPVRIPA